MKTKFTLLSFLLILCTGLIAQGGYMSLTVTQPTDSVSNDGSLHIDLVGITQPAQLELYSLPDTGPAITYIGSGFDIHNLAEGNYVVLGALSSHHIQTSTTGANASAQTLYSVNDLVGQFTLGQSMARGYLSNIIISPVQTVDPTASGCDGIVYFDTSLTSHGILTLFLTDTGLRVAPGVVRASDGRDSAGAFCTGRYASATIIGANLATTFFIGNEFDAFPDFSASAVPYLASAPGQCDGAAGLSVIGGAAPYLWYVDSVAYTSPAVTGLCEGFHTYFVRDSSGRLTSTKNLVIGDMQNYIQNPNPYSSTAIDTFYINTQNCNYDYSNGIDSSYITSITAVSATEYIVNFEVWQQGQQIGVTDTVYIDTVGVNAIQLTMYCDTTHRSVQGTVTVLSYINTAYALGLADTKADAGKIQIYPNPTSGRATVEIKSGLKGQYDLSIINVTGQLVKQIKSITTPKTSLDIISLPPGVYTVMLRGETGVSTQPLVKY